MEYHLLFGLAVVFQRDGSALGHRPAVGISEGSAGDFRKEIVEALSPKDAARLLPKIRSAARLAKVRRNSLSKRTYASSTVSKTTKHSSAPIILILPDVL